MTKTFIGNAPAYAHMENYVKTDHPGPLILSGKSGLGKRKAALSLAAFLLKCPEDELSRNRDFLQIDKGKETVRVEDVLNLLDQSSVTALGAVKVFLICHAEKINAQAQNKLLKLLEDRNRSNIVIFICERDALLATIKSRCLTIEFSPLQDSEMEEYLNSHGIEDDRDFISNLCDNCPYRLEDALAVYPALKETYSKILSARRREDLLSVFHLVKEKDSEEFYSAHAEHYMMALQMLQYLFYSLLLIQLNDVPVEVSGAFAGLAALYCIPETHRICTAVADHQRQWLSGGYTKNDFFDLVRVMIQNR